MGKKFLHTSNLMKVWFGEKVSHLGKLVGSLLRYRLRF